MRNYFDMQMKTLHQELKEMGGLCQLTISKTYQLLHNGDVEVIKSIAAPMLWSTMTAVEGSVP